MFQMCVCFVCVNGERSVMCVSHLMVEVVERGLVLGEVAEEPFGQVAYPEFVPGNTEESHGGLARPRQHGRGG